MFTEKYFLKILSDLRIEFGIPGGLPALIASFRFIEVHVSSSCIDGELLSVQQYSMISIYSGLQFSWKLLYSDADPSIHLGFFCNNNF